MATALWLINRDGELKSPASPEQDRGGIEIDIRQAMELGHSRARAAADARLRNKRERN